MFEESTQASEGAVMLDAVPAEGQGNDSDALAQAGTGADAAAEFAAQKGEEGSAKETAPESYEAFQVPEDVEYDPQMEASFGELAKELGLNQEQAQKAVDWYLEKLKLSQADLLTKQDDYIEQLKQQSLSDPEIGGSKWRGDAEVSVKLALDKLGTPELRQVIAENPALSCHPEVIRFFKRAGDLLREGKSETAQAGVQGPSVADVLFDKS